MQGNGMKGRGRGVLGSEWDNNRGFNVDGCGWVQEGVCMNRCLLGRRRRWCVSYIVVGWW